MPDLTEMLIAAALGGAVGWVATWPLRALLRANLRAWDLFAYDKAQAEAGGSRVPEAELLAAAAWGGWPGAKLAQRRFRHKTRKEPFRSQLNRIGRWQGVALLLGLPVLVAVLSGQVALPVGWQVAQAQDEAPPPALPRRFGPGS